MTMPDPRDPGARLTRDPYRAYPEDNIGWVLAGLVALVIVGAVIAYNVGSNEPPTATKVDPDSTVGQRSNPPASPRMVPLPPTRPDPAPAPNP